MVSAAQEPWPAQAARRPAGRPQQEPLGQPQPPATGAPPRQESRSGRRRSRSRGGDARDQGPPLPGDGAREDGSVVSAVLAEALAADRAVLAVSGGGSSGRADAPASRRRSKWDDGAPGEMPGVGTTPYNVGEVGGVLGAAPGKRLGGGFDSTIPTAGSLVVDPTTGLVLPAEHRTVLKEIRIPQNLKSGLIGKGGEWINFIRNESKAGVKLSHNDGDAEAVIEIKGTKEVIQHAEVLIHSRLQEVSGNRALVVQKVEEVMMKKTMKIPHVKGGCKGGKGGGCKGGGWKGGGGSWGGNWGGDHGGGNDFGGGKGGKGHKVRTKPCQYYMQGRCTFGDACQFSHDPELIAAAMGAMEAGPMQPIQPGPVMQSFQNWGGEPGGMPPPAPPQAFAGGQDSSGDWSADPPGLGGGAAPSFPPAAVDMSALPPAAMTKASMPAAAPATASPPPVPYSPEAPPPTPAPPKASPPPPPPEPEPLPKETPPAASSSAPSSSAASKPKTAGGFKEEMCKFWQEGGCTFGAACFFAHGPDELVGADKGQEKSPGNKDKQRNHDNKDSGADHMELVGGPGGADQSGSVKTGKDQKADMSVMDQIAQMMGGMDQIEMMGATDQLTQMAQMVEMGAWSMEQLMEQLAPMVAMMSGMYAQQGQTMAFSSEAPPEDFKGEGWGESWGGKGGAWGKGGNGDKGSKGDKGGKGYKGDKGGKGGKKGGKGKPSASAEAEAEFAAKLAAFRNKNKIASSGGGGWT
ncbi:unnamed protein product [Prorocentrum cordatum]|uniref:C3H1-type domain-containing protein n=1 Tax=Prorocentrum cordatum TaxID=2364126 RepID=A0ABN9XS45_9DINO|nr:unnamed protein product [Polarella glacialis]